jgi:YbbR domain-containing protein
MTDAEPRSLRLKAHKLVEMKLPIEAKLTGKLAEGYSLARVVTEPGRVEVLVPSFLEGYVNELATEPIDIEQLRETKTVQKNLVMPQHVRLKGEQPEQIRVRLEVDKKPAKSAPRLNGPGL